MPLTHEHTVLHDLGSLRSLKKQLKFYFRISEDKKDPVRKQRKLVLLKLKKFDELFSDLQVFDDKEFYLKVLEALVQADDVSERKKYVSSTQ